MTLNRGVLIAFAGPDASGKSSIIHDVVEKFTDLGSKWVVFHYPNRDTVIGKKINEILNGRLQVSPEVELRFFAYNRSEDKDLIMNMINVGINVILDRYVHCSMAYTFTNQAHNVLYNNHPDVMSMDQIMHYDHGNIKPDFVFLVKGNFLHLRETREVKDYDGSLREILYNNYLLSFLHTHNKFAIVDNTSETNIDEVAQKVVNIINRVIYDNNIVNRAPMFF